MDLANTIYVFNKPYRNVLRGALIHKINESEAQNVADLIEHYAPQLAIPDALPYLLAVIGQESRFDRTAHNYNLTPWEAMLGYPLDYNKGDYGLGQMKLKYVKVSADSPELWGLPDIDIIEGFLYSSKWMVPKVASRYANNLRFARQLYPDDDPKWIATGFWKAGATGFKEAYKTKDGPVWRATLRHIDRVKAHYNWFKEQLK